MLKVTSLPGTSENGLWPIEKSMKIVCEIATFEYNHVLEYKK